MKVSIEQLQVGQRYRIHFCIPIRSNSPVKECVMRYMGTQGRATALLFDLRPLGGTQKIEPVWIKAMWITSAPLMAPRKYQPETRVV